MSDLVGHYSNVFTNRTKGVQPIRSAKMVKLRK